MLSTASRNGSLTQEALRTLPTPGNLAVDGTALAARGDSTVVTFATHASYGSPHARKETTACYQATLTPGREPPEVREVAVSVCAGSGSVPAEVTAGTR